MAISKKNLKDFPRPTGSGSLMGLIETGDLVKLRDPFIIFDYDDTDGRYQIGYAIIYPGGKTGGHAHEDAEEIYHIIDGKGRMIIGEEEFDIGAGDTFIVPSQKMHSTKNTGNMPMKFFWSVIKK